MKHIAVLFTFTFLLLATLKATAVDFPKNNDATPYISQAEQQKISKMVITDIFQSRGIPVTQGNLNNQSLLQGEVGQAIVFLTILYLRCDKCYYLAVENMKMRNLPIYVSNVKAYLDSQQFLTHLKNYGG